MRYRSLVSSFNLIRNTSADLKFLQDVQLRLPMVDNISSNEGAYSIVKIPQNGSTFHIGSVGMINQTYRGDVNVNAIQMSDVVNELRALSGHLKANNTADRQLIAGVEDAIFLPDANNPRLLNHIKKIGEKVLEHTGAIGADILEAFIKKQLGID